MKKSLYQPFDKRHYVKTTVLLVLSLASLGGALITGITDNATGIILLFLSSLIFISALTYTWTNPFRFFIMAGAGVAIIVLLYITLHIMNLLIPLETLNKYNGIIEATGMLSVFFLLLPAIIVGVIGGIYKAAKETRDENVVHKRHPL
jgi:hypothetical protein